jgi:hypothetical protein
MKKYVLLPRYDGKINFELEYLCHYASRILQLALGLILDIVRDSTERIYPKVAKKVV